MKSILCISRHSPRGSALAREALDAVLAAAVFDQRISVLWMDDGVYQLLRENENSGQSGHLQKPLGALGLYGVEHLYVHRPSLQERGIELAQLLPDTAFTPLDDDQVAKLLAGQQQVLSF